MLTITKKQMKVFEKASLRSFEDEMVLHSKEFSPKHSEKIGDKKLRIVIQQAMKRANSYGFTLKGPIRIYIELTLLFGRDFDADKKYSGVSEILQSDNDEMLRAEKIHDWVLDNNMKGNSSNQN
ncbi:MAG: hypothetical protein L3J51_13405 [Cocleimonas sp.]|nr:hypothetical protein [Cocleimonas sp.]